MRQAFAHRTIHPTIGVEIVGIDQTASGSGDSLGDSLDQGHKHFRRTIGRTGAKVEDGRIPTDLLKPPGIRCIQIHRLNIRN
jgi:hypothetical protein